MEISADFAGFSRVKSENSLKNGPISREKVKICRKMGQFRGILVEKSQIRKDFRGQLMKNRPISREISGGKIRQETVSKKQPISLDSFGKFR